MAGEFIQVQSHVPIQMTMPIFLMGMEMTSFSWVNHMVVTKKHCHEEIVLYHLQLVTNHLWQHPIPFTIILLNKQNFYEPLYFSKIFLHSCSLSAFLKIQIKWNILNLLIRFSIVKTKIKSYKSEPLPTLLSQPATTSSVYQSLQVGAPNKLFH